MYPAARHTALDVGGRSSPRHLIDNEGGFMSYTVQFIGLACFLRDGNDRQVLFPDGRVPAAGVQPHYASIVVGSDSIKEAGGWNGDGVLSSGVFELPPCDLTIEGADTPGSLDTSRHDG